LDDGIKMYYFLVRLHTTAKAVSEAEYSTYGATKQGAQVTQVCFILFLIGVDSLLCLFGLVLGILV